MKCPNCQFIISDRIKERCKNGHDMSKSSKIRPDNGQRYCYLCHKDRSKKNTAIRNKVKKKKFEEWLNGNSND